MVISIIRTYEMIWNYIEYNVSTTRLSADTHPIRFGIQSGGNALLAVRLPNGHMHYLRHRAGFSFQTIRSFVTSSVEDNLVGRGDVIV